MILAEQIRREMIDFWTNATLEEMAEELIEVDKDTASEGADYITTDDKSFWLKWGPVTCHPTAREAALEHQIELLKTEI